MKTYRVWRSRSRGVQAQVMQTGRAIEPLPHVKLHSWTGFETGYGGSGPADLALSILADYFGEAPEQILLESKAAVPDRSHKPSRALAMYQRFKADIISGQDIDADDWYDIDEETIGEWLRQRSNLDVVATAVALLLVWILWLAIPAGL